MSKENTKKFINRKKRNKFGLPIVLSLDNDTIKLPARLNDLNDQGFSFKTNINFSLNEIFDIIIPFPKGVLFFDQHNLKPLIINVETRWCKNFQDKDDFLVKYIVGVKIISSNDDDFKNKIIKLVKLSEQLGQKPLGY